MSPLARRSAVSISENESSGRPRAGHAGFIGRVGALAVFLGVGTALAVPGVAAADSTDSSGSGPSTSQSDASESDADRNADAGQDSDSDSAEQKRRSTKASNEDDKAEDLGEADEADEADKADDVDEAGDHEDDVEATVRDSESAEVVDIPHGGDDEPEAPPVEPEPAMATVVTALLTGVLNPQGAGDTSPTQTPAKWAAASLVRRQEADAATPTAGAVPTAATQALSLEAQAAAPSAPRAPFLPFTRAAIGNAITMVLSHPFQVLSKPITAAVFIVNSVVDGLLTDMGLVPALPYANSGWVTLHGDPGNRKFQPGVDLSQNYNRWSALQGAGILAAPTILPNGNVVVTTGVAAGGSNLHVIDREGNIVWQAQPWDGQEGVDSGAVLSSPIIDRAGNIYISDGDQVWSFADDGTVRWVTALPTAPDNPALRPGSRNINPFITATLTHDGSVLGVTVYGQIVALDGKTGELAAPIFQIPGPLAARAATEPPPTLWTGGYMDPTIIDPIWQVAFGGLYRTTNTPGVDSKTGRVFVAATDIEAGKGALYGIDYISATPFSRGEIKVAFATQMGPGSGSSPTVSTDGRVVYASDDAGVLYAFSTRTGKQIWATASNAEAASVAVDGSGNIYVLTRNNVMSSFDSAGELRWLADVSALTQELPVSPILGAPVAIGGGNPTVVNGRVVQSVVYGYNFVAQGRTVFVPVKATLVEFDPETGKGIRNIVDTNEGTEGILNIAPDGRMYASLGAITTTSVAPLAPIINSLLPAGLKVLTPSGGFNGFTPAVL